MHWQLAWAAPVSATNCLLSHKIKLDSLGLLHVMVQIWRHLSLIDVVFLRTKKIYHFPSSGLHTKDCSSHYVFFVHWINVIFHINLRNSVKYSSGMIYFCYSHRRQEIYFSSPACLCVRRSRGGGAVIPVTHSQDSAAHTPAQARSLPNSPKCGSTLLE